MTQSKDNLIIANIDKAMLMTLFAEMINRMEHKEAFLDKYFEFIQKDISDKITKDLKEDLQRLITVKAPENVINLKKQEIDDVLKKTKYYVNLHRDTIKAEVK